MNRTNNLVCDETLLKHIRANLNQFESRKHPGQGNKTAAVAVTVVDVNGDPGVYGITGNEHRRDQAALILTRRGSS